MFDRPPILLIMLYYVTNSNQVVTPFYFFNSDNRQILPCFNLTTEIVSPGYSSTTFEFGDKRTLRDSWILYTYRSEDLKTIYWSSKPSYSGAGSGTSESQFNEKTYTYYWLCFC